MIHQVESDTSSSLLIPQINKESDKEKLRVKNHLNSHLMDMKYWKPCNINPENDLKYDIELYENQIKAISKYAELRKAFVRKKISKEKFLSQAEILKPRIEI